MKILTFLIILFFYNFSCICQTRILFLDSLSQNPVSKVNCREKSGVVFGVSDEFGVCIVSADTIFVSHVGFKSLMVVPKDKKNLTINLLPLVIELKEVTVGYELNPQKIIAQVLENYEENYLTNYQRNYHLNSSTVANKIEVIKFSGAVNYTRLNGDLSFYVKKDAEINRMYYDNRDANNEINFSIEIGRIFRGGFFENFPFFEKPQKYNFTIVKSQPGYYEIGFSPKKTTAFSYTGSIVVDRSDFSLISLSADLVKHRKNNKASVFNGVKPVDKYNFISENFDLKFNKSVDQHFLESGTYSIILDQNNKKLNRISYRYKSDTSIKFISNGLQGGFSLFDRNELRFK